ncbi:MAG: hypothetical protein ACM3NQ_14760 [Bacteroidales bacterium]
MACGLAVVALVTVAATPAFAQLFRASPSDGASYLLDIRGSGGTSRGTDVKYDPAHNVFLAVSGHGLVAAQFVDASGNALGSPFTIMDGSTYFAHFPRATFSQDINGGQGGFLVTWHENSYGTSTNEVHGVLVAYPTGVISADVKISDGALGSTSWERPAPAAYSVTSQRFLVVWTTLDWGVQGRFVDKNGTPIGAVLPIENPGGSMYAATTWNPITDEFGISYCGWGASGAFARFRKMGATTGAVSPRTTFGYGGGTFVSDIAFNTTNNTYVMVWGTAGDVQASSFDVSGNQIGVGLVTPTVAAQDNLGLAYNPASGTFLVVGHSKDTYDSKGIELNANGAPNSLPAQVTTGATAGAFYPRTSANTGLPQFAVIASFNLRIPAIQIMGTTSTNGGSTAPLGTPFSGGGGTGGTGSTPAPGGCTTPDPFASLGGGVCVNGGWLPPGSGGTPVTSTPGGCTTPQPAAGWTCVGGGWLPPGTGGGTSGGSTGSCATADPFASLGGGTCVNGAWLPPGSGGGTTGGTSGTGCSSVQPGAGWVCVNGGWLPPGSGGTTGGGTTGTGCSSVQPGANWVCVNGGWLPPGSGGTTTGGTSGCGSVQPGADWVCVNGGWLPPGSGGTTTGGTSGCSSVQPGTGWVCVNGGWLPPGTGTTSSGSCTTPDPFTAIGGGTCVNGAWLPKGM